MLKEYMELPLRELKILHYTLFSKRRTGGRSDWIGYRNIGHDPYRGVRAQVCMHGTLYACGGGPIRRRGEAQP